MATIMRVREVGEFPPVTELYAPSDYLHLNSRGTIEYNSIWRNYSYHNVTIPADAIVRDCNFSQFVPSTSCISIVEDGTVTFIDCNMVNVNIDPSWVIEGCNTCQSWVVTITDAENGDYEEREHICSHQDDLPDPLTPPANAITTRDNEDITFGESTISTIVMTTAE